jgi:hypothetical protein
LFRLNSVGVSTNRKQPLVGSSNEMNAKSNKIMKFCLRHFIVTNSAAASRHSLQAISNVDLNLNT